LAIFTWYGKEYGLDDDIPCMVFKNGKEDDIRPVNLFSGIDPAPGNKKDSGDFYVNMVIGIDSMWRIYVLDYVRDRIEIDEQANLIIQNFITYRKKIKRTTIETIAYQESLRSLCRMKMKEKGLYIPGLETGTKPRSEKSSRHDKIIGYVKTGKLFIKQSHYALKTELLTVHAAKKSPDCLDALWNALFNAMPYSGENLNSLKKDVTGSFVLDKDTNYGDEDDWLVI